MIVIYEPGDPVRLDGRRGLFRFVNYSEGTNPLAAFELGPHGTAEVVGPIGKSERLYTVPVTDLKMPPPTATREQVGMHPGVAHLSHTAKTSGRRR